jgi:hypothetical protein
VPGDRGDVTGEPGGWLPEWISLGLLAASVPREVVDAAVAASGRGAQRSGGKLPPHVMVYYAMALALFADEDYEAVMARLTETLASWECWDQAWTVPTSGGITRARTRLGSEPLARIFDEVAVPVADQLTRGAWLGPWRLMAIDGLDWDLPDTDENVAEFGYVGSGATRSSFPKARAVTISECASHAVVAAAIGGMDTGEQTLAARLWDRLEPDWLLTADRNFYGFNHWNAARATGAELLWRVSSRVALPVLHTQADGSYTALLTNRRKINSRRRAEVIAALLAAARRGEDLDPAVAVPVRVIEYTVPDRDGNGRGETFTLITTILDPAQASAEQLAQAYHQRWEHETGNDQLKTHLRGPGKILRSTKPDTVRQEIYGYLLTHYAISALICRAATAADIDPDRIKFQRTVRIVRRRVTDSAAFPP